jgi:hypothetical protein
VEPRVSHYERLQIDSLLHPREGAIVQAGVAVFLASEGAEAEHLYEVGVGPALRANGLNRVSVVRVFNSDSTLVEVSRWLLTAEVIIAELSTVTNGDLMYVLGLAHGMGRCPLLLVHRDAELPFNLAGLRHVQYTRSAGGLLVLRSDLTRAVRVFLAAARATGVGGQQPD